MKSADDAQAGWDICGEIWTENPRLLVPPAYLGLVRLQRMSHAGGLARTLPQAGGLLDQSAWLMEAFAVIEDAWAWFEPKNPSSGGGAAAAR